MGGWGDTECKQWFPLERTLPRQEVLKRSAPKVAERRGFVSKRSLFYHAGAKHVVENIQLGETDRGSVHSKNKHMGWGGGVGDQ